MVDSRGQVEAIKERVDIANVIQRYVNLKPAGRNLVGLCPFHNEKTPSFSVNQELQIFKCFGCGKGGDVFAFLQEIEKIDFPEALERLAKEAGVKLVKSDKPDKFAYLSEINTLAQKFFTTQLYKHKEIQNYLVSRGINKELADKFSIGYSPGGKELLESIRSLKKYTKSQILSCGLFIEKNGEIRDKFSKRVMFPILSPRGKIIAFSGRLLPGNDFGPKYMNSPETPLFSKRAGVYGLYQARQAIRREDLCIVCEGQIDVISAHKAGVENAVAPLGTAITSEQINLISKMTKNILFIFDNDEAGQKALEKAFLICSQSDINAYAANPTPYSDLDELVQKEEKLVKKVIKPELDAFSYLVTQQVKDKDLKNFSEYTKAVAYIKRLLGAVKDPSIYAFYSKKVEDITGIQIEGQETENKSRSFSKEETEKIEISLNSEHYYLKALLSQPILLIPENHKIDIFTDILVKNILQKIKEKDGITLKELAQEIEDDQRNLFEIITMSPTPVNASDLTNLYTRIERSSLDRQIAQARERLVKAEKDGNAEEVEKQFHIIKELSNKLQIKK